MEILTMGTNLLYLACAGILADAGIIAYKSFTKVSKTGSAYKGKPKEIENYLGTTGARLSMNVQLSENAMYEHVIVFGKTGSKKTTTQYLPNLLSNDFPKSSLIIFDMKGEIFEATSNYQQNTCGRKVVVYSPLRPEISIGINPLAICEDITQIRKLAMVLIANADKSFSESSSGGAEWKNMTMSLMCAALAYCKHKGGEQCNITSALDLVVNHTNNELEMLFRNSTTEVMDQWNIFKTCLNATGGISSSIKITLASALQIFLDYKIAATSSKDEFRPEMLRKTPIALYVIYPETSSDYIAPLMATIFSQLIDYNLEYFDKNPKSLPIFNFLDEYCNAGYLPAFNHTITAARSRKFSFNICIHDVRQLFRLYGQDLTYTILNNASCKVVLPGISEPTTLDFISTIAGESEISIQNESTTGEKTTVNTSKQKKRLYTSNEVRCLDDDTCLIIINNKQAVPDKLNIYHKHKIYNDRVVKQYL